MTTSASAGAAAAPGLLPDNQTLVQRMAGMVVQPRRTVDRVVADPRWGGVLLASTLIAVVFSATVMNTAVGRQALVDEWERTAAAVGHEVDDAGYQQLEGLSRYATLYAAAGAVISVPVVAVAMAGLLHVFFGRGGRVRRPFTAALAIAVHAGVILSLRQVVAAGFTYGRETTATALSLGSAFPGLDASSPMARALGVIDVFVVWWVVVLALGTARLYHRHTRSTVLTFVGVYLALAVLTAAAFTAAGAAA